MDNTNPITPRSEYLVLQKIATALLMLTVIITYVPLNVGMPGVTLDSSWEWAMNQAQALHMVMGKDIIFTFGPYASIFTRVYHPDTDRLMLLGSIPLALFAAALVYNLTKSRSIIWKLFFTGFIATGFFSRDVSFFLYPMFIALYIYNVSTDKVNNVAFSNSKKLFCISLFIPMGLLLLVKASFLLLVVGITGLSAALFWFKGMKKTAVAICVAPLLSIVFFQLMAHQPIAALWYYFKNMLPIIGGFSEAMSLHGDKKEVLLFMLASFLILLICYKNKEVPGTFRWYLLLSLALFLFTAFKAGFTRHDGHAMAASASLLSLAFMLFTILTPTMWVQLLLLFSATTWVYIDFTYVGTEVLNIFRPVPGLYVQSLDGLMVRLKGDGGLKARYAQRMSEVKNDPFKIPTLPGTTDIYSYEQGYVLASDNTWAPRPIFQSYSVYTDKLAQLNEAHLTSNKAPNNIIFAVQPIDYRYPAMEDGLSWPTIINNYQPDHLDSRFLFLKQKKAHNTTPGQKELYTIHCKFGEDVKMPDTTQVLFARFEIKQGLLGKVSNTLYRPDPVSIYVTTVDGRTLQYRFIPGMSRSGFILSPLISSTNEFAQLFGKTDSLKNNYIRSFKIESDGLGIRSLFNTWNKEYTLHLSQINYDK